MLNRTSSPTVQVKMLLLAVLTALPMVAQAHTYLLPTNGAELIGQKSSIRIQATKSLSDIAIDSQVGFDALYSANPGFITESIPTGSNLSLPTQLILPDVKREGIVINLPELRLYYFHSDKKRVSVYPIGIGKSGWETPLMDSSISQIRANPSWTPPESIRQAYLEDGIVLPRSIPPGPDNPLGSHALRLGDTNILIHGTANPRGVGRRVSSGCIRLYNAHISELVSLVSHGTKVKIINQPIKWANQEGTHYIEAHKPLAGNTPPSTDAQRKHSLHHGFRRAQRVAGSNARKQAEKFAYALQTKRRLFTGLPLRVK